MEKILKKDITFKRSHFNTFNTFNIFVKNQYVGWYFYSRSEKSICLCMLSSKCLYDNSGIFHTSGFGFTRRKIVDLISGLFFVSK